MLVVCILECVPDGFLNLEPMPELQLVEKFLVVSRHPCRLRLGPLEVMRNVVGGLSAWSGAARLLRWGISDCADRRFGRCWACFARAGREVSHRGVASFPGS